MFKIKLPLFTLFLGLLLVSSCGRNQQSQLIFKDSVSTQNTLIADKLLLEKKRAEFALEKARVWKEINDDAKKSFEGIRKVFNYKCMNCHDASYKLPLYGKIFEGINPVHKHQVEGLKALNFEKGYPFLALGNPPQISILKAIRNSVVEKTMPLKSFTFVYPKKKINEEDENIILAWVDPIIEKINDYEIKYNLIDANLDTRAHSILEAKCFRCHANGNTRGGFGGMEDTEKLLNGKYVSKDNPEQSQIFTTIRDGEMPPSKMDALTAEEQYVIRDWLESVSKPKPKVK